MVCKVLFMGWMVLSKKNWGRKGGRGRKNEGSVSGQLYRFTHVVIIFSSVDAAALGKVDTTLLQLEPLRYAVSGSRCDGIGWRLVEPNSCGLHGETK